MKKKIIFIVFIVTITLCIGISNTVAANPFQSLVSKQDLTGLIDIKPNINTCSPHSSNNSSHFVGTASLVIFHFGDSDLTTAFQQTVPLSDAFRGYDYKVLLYDDSTDASKLLSSKAISEADVVADPTEENFFDLIEDIVDQGYLLDIYILAHGNINSSGVPYFKASGSRITGEDILDLKNLNECGQIPIRMVYTVACYQEAMNDYWIDAGAKVAVGSTLINFYPNQFGKFARKWTDGNSVKTSVDKSNTSASRTFAQTYIYLLGLGHANQGECGLWPNVLGKNDCAEWYFTGGGEYNLGSDYDASISGKSNMNESSEKFIDGDENITIDSTLTWNLPN